MFDWGFLLLIKQMFELIISCFFDVLALNLAAGDVILMLT